MSKSFICIKKISIRFPYALLIALFLCLIISGCGQGYVKRDYIIVFHRAGIPDFNVAHPASEMKALFDKMSITDTVFLDSGAFDEIVDNMYLNHVQKIDNSFIPVLFVKYNNMEFCLDGTSNICTLPNVKSYFLLNDRASYCIKDVCGFYKGLQRDDLEYCREVKKYGIPKSWRPTRFYVPAHDNLCDIVKRVSGWKTLIVRDI